MINENCDKTVSREIQDSNLKPFKKGEDNRRNPNGRPKKLPELSALMAEVLGEETDGLTAAQQILKALRTKAKRGDIRAAEALLNRGYGLPKQSLEVSGGLILNWNEQKTYEAKPETDAGA